MAVTIIDESDPYFCLIRKIAERPRDFNLGRAAIRRIEAGGLDFHARMVAAKRAGIQCGFVPRVAPRVEPLMIATSGSLPTGLGRDDGEALSGREAWVRRVPWLERGPSAPRRRPDRAYGTHYG